MSFTGIYILSGLAFLLEYTELMQYLFSFVIDINENDENRDENSDDD